MKDIRRLLGRHLPSFTWSNDQTDCVPEISVKLVTNELGAKLLLVLALWLTCLGLGTYYCYLAHYDVLWFAKAEGLLAILIMALNLLCFVYPEKLKYAFPVATIATQSLLFLSVFLHVVHSGGVMSSALSIFCWLSCAGTLFFSEESSAHIPVWTFVISTSIVALFLARWTDLPYSFLGIDWKVVGGNVEATIAGLCLFGTILFSTTVTVYLEKTSAKRILEKKQFMYNVTSALQSHLHEITEKITSNNFADSLDCTDVRMGISHMEKTLRSIRSNLNGSEENDLNLLMEDFDMTVLLKNLERTTRYLLSALGKNELEVSFFIPREGTENHQRLKYLRGPLSSIVDCLYNMLTNAIKYTNSGRVSVCVSLDVIEEGFLARPPDFGRNQVFLVTHDKNHVDPDNEYVLQLCVRDTGRGMSSQTLSKLAEPFKQADPTRDCGSGIGLAIAKQFVERMNGNFIVRSQLGIGTEMILEVPLQAGGKPITEYAYEKHVFMPNIHKRADPQSSSHRTATNQTSFGDSSSLAPALRSGSSQGSGNFTLIYRSSATEHHDTPLIRSGSDALNLPMAQKDSFSVLDTPLREASFSPASKILSPRVKRVEWDLQQPPDEAVLSSKQSDQTSIQHLMEIDTNMEIDTEVHKSSASSSSLPLVSGAEPSNMEVRAKLKQKKKSSKRGGTSSKSQPRKRKFTIQKTVVLLARETDEIQRHVALLRSAGIHCTVLFSMKQVLELVEATRGFCEIKKVVRLPNAPSDDNVPQGMDVDFEVVSWPEFVRGGTPLGAGDDIRDDPASKPCLDDENPRKRRRLDDSITQAATENRTVHSP